MNAEDDLPPKMLTDTREPQIKELIVNGKNQALRLLLCKGPTDKSSEWTLLFGCTEKDRKYIPKDAPERAEQRRQLVISDSLKYRKRRVNDYSK